MNTHLIADAVRNSRGREETTIWDRLFAFWFRRLVYTQIWEDPEADMAALKLAPGSTIVTISSGGCNALSYLSAKPEHVYAVDLNEAHLSLLKLKLAGLRALPNYQDFLEILRRRRLGYQCGPVSRAAARRCSMPKRAAIGTNAISRAAPVTVTSATASIATARSAASSASRIRLAKLCPHRSQGVAARRQAVARRASARWNACTGCSIRGSPV